jgi:hypothetical protein
MFETILLYLILSATMPAVCPTATGSLPISPFVVLLAFLTENIPVATALYIKQYNLSHYLHVYKVFFLSEIAHFIIFVTFIKKIKRPVN